MNPQVSALICLLGLLVAAAASFRPTECLSLCNTFGGCQVARSMSEDNTLSGSGPSSGSAAAAALAYGSSGKMKDASHQFNNHLEDLLAWDGIYYDDDDDLGGQMIDYASGSNDPDTPGATGTKPEAKLDTTKEGSLDSLKMAKEFFGDHL